MNSEVAAVTEHYRIRVLPFRVVADSARRVLGRQCHVWLREVLGLDRDSSTNFPKQVDDGLTRSNHSFSNLSITISKAS